MDKLRGQLNRRRDALSKVEVEAYSTCIARAVTPYMKAGLKVGFYMATSQEVQLYSLLNYCIDFVQCAVPKITGSSMMSFYCINENCSMVQNKWGILEPIKGIEVSPMDFDVIIVPIVGFDEELHRMGHGKGYYDRYLANTKALKIGVAFEVQKCDALPSKPHDIDMDIIITEAHTYKKAR